ncbi:TetR/AcrR family transcriptional regulator [Arthrobacter sp. HY1533]|uniref:TetR/AcrR family transcriptional regulator n=1 Tax=Arthrobacter sp. HY1533 TaxID=2970919 RepID=UPI0022B9ED57|nr:TetR/AcrR family transcriptional regulator [Arthrobacter sp. HY1533]
MDPTNPAVNEGRPAELRRARVAANRARMVTAAAGLFAARGFTGTTMEAVSAASGMSVQSVYFVFHNKAKLLQAAFDQAAMGAVDPTPPPQSTWYLAALQAATAEEALRGLVHGNCRILQGTAPLTLAAASAAAGDPVVAELHARNEGLRMEVLSEMTRQLGARRNFRPGMTLSKAMDVAYGLLSPQLFTLLTQARGWTPEEFADWVADSLQHELWG